MSHFVDVSERAIVSLVGTESLDLLQRISTNDVAKINAGGSAQTVLTNEKGRIVEVISVLDRGEDGLLAVGQSSDPVALKQYIEKYIIMEDIILEVLSDQMTHVMLFNSMQNIADVIHPSVLRECLIFDEAFSTVRLTHVVVGNAFRQVVLKELLAAGVVENSQSEYEEFRVLNGVPGFPGELSLLYNPLEAGLLPLVSFTKGCYVGQEVVARLDTYKKVQRRLVRLGMKDLPAELPEKIYHEGQEWGSLTSAVRLSGTLECRGLGYVRTGSELVPESLCFHKGTEAINLVVES